MVVLLTPGRRALPPLAANTARARAPNSDVATRGQMREGTVFRPGNVLIFSNPAATSILSRTRRKIVEMERGVVERFPQTEGMEQAHDGRRVGNADQERPARFQQGERFSQRGHRVGQVFQNVEQGDRPIRPFRTGKPLERAQTDGEAFRGGGGHRRRGRIDPFDIPPAIPHQGKESPVPASHVQEAAGAGAVGLRIEPVGRFPEYGVHEPVPAGLVSPVPAVVLRVEGGKILRRGPGGHVDQPAPAATDDAVPVLDRDLGRVIAAAEEAGGKPALRRCAAALQQWQTPFRNDRGGTPPIGALAACRFFATHFTLAIPPDCSATYFLSAGS